MPGEKEWVAELAPRLQKAIRGRGEDFACVGVAAHVRLPYTHEVFAYGEQQGSPPPDHSYQTDLLIRDVLSGERWVPRVVIECKLKSVTTHAILAYSAKACTHKQVHPYLRYGFLVGGHGRSEVPVRLFRHGAYFDFMVTWASSKATPRQWGAFVDMLVDEIEASRKVLMLLAKKRGAKEKGFSLVHRRLLLLNPE